jgi:SAM-dependent methyltransferase
MVRILKYCRSTFSIFLSRFAGKKEIPKQSNFPSETATQIQKESKAERTARVWDAKGLCREEHRKLNWMDFSIIEHCINESVSGDPQINWFLWVKEKYFKQKRDCGLVLGCGDGSLERHGIALGVCDCFDAFDVSEKSIEFARSEAHKGGFADRVDYQTCDINHITLPIDKYDVVFCAMSLHHFSRLDYVIGEIKHSLKPDGLFIFNEYVGPSQFQWTDKQLRIINAILELLPKKYRKDLSRLGLTVKKEVIRPAIEDMERVDPSEAIRSAEIIPLVDKHFTILEKLDYGGTLLHTLLHNIVGNFDPQKEEDVALLKLLHYLEMLLIKEEVLESDFVLVVAAKETRDRAGAITLGNR